MQLLTKGVDLATYGLQLSSAFPKAMLKLLLVALCQRPEGNPKILIESRRQDLIAVIVSVLLRHHRIVRAGSTQDIQQLQLVRLSHLRSFLQAQYFLASEATVFDKKLEQLMRKRALVGRVEIEAVGPHYQIFRIRRLKNQQPSRLEDAQRFTYQLLKYREGYVLDNVKTRNEDLTLRRQRLQCTQGIALNRWKSSVATGLEHTVVEVDPLGLEALLDQQFKPLATTTANVECRTGFIGFLERL